MKPTIKTDIVIVGAGPTGLSFGCQLLRYGINFIIVEKNEGITPYSKAIGVHARTLEIFDQIGLAQEAVARGTVAGAARLIIDGEIRGELRFADVGKGMSPFPFVLMLEQTQIGLPVRRRRLVGRRGAADQSNSWVMRLVLASSWRQS